MLLILIILLILLLSSNSMLLLKSSNDIITIKGKDSVRLLQALTTSDFDGLGSTLLNSNQNCLVCPTTFVNVKGHLLYHCNCLVRYDNNDDDYIIKLIIDSNQGDSLRNYFNKYIFPLDRVKVVNEKKKGTLITALYNRNDNNNYRNTFDNNLKKIFKRIIGDDLSMMKPDESWKGYKSASVYESESEYLYSWLGNSFVSIDNKEPEDVYDENLKQYVDGFTIIGESENKIEQLVKLLEAEGLTVPLEQERVWDSIRLATGLPSSFYEIGSPMNATALELGMMHSISFGKGCYTGQESLAHAITASGPQSSDGRRLNAVRRHLVGLKFKDTSNSLKVTRLSDIIDDTNESIGIVTTSPITSTGIDTIDKLAQGKMLGLVKSSLAVNNQNLFVVATNDKDEKENIPVKVELLSYPRFDAFKSSSSPPVVKLPNKGRSIEVPANKESVDVSPEAIAKAKKLEEMAAKVLIS